MLRSPSTSDGIIEKINIKIGDKVSEGDLLVTVNVESKMDVKEKPVQKNKIKEVVSKKSDPVPFASCSIYIRVKISKS